MKPTDDAVACSTGNPDVPEQVKADTRIRRNFLTTVIIPDMYDLRDTQIPEDLEDPLDESEVPY